MKKIALIGLTQDTNLGERIIYNNVHHVVNQICFEKGITDYEIVKVDLYGRTAPDVYAEDPKDFKAFRRFQWKFYSSLYSKVNKINQNKEDTFWKPLENFCWIHKWTAKKYCRRSYYLSKLKDADIIIVIGAGLLKYRVQKYFIYLKEVLGIANEFNIPCIINSVGVEGYSETDSRSRSLKKTLNDPMMKMVTTRDDYDTLLKYIPKTSHVKTAKVADTAVWSADTYSEFKKETDTNIIGICMVREKIYNENGFPFNKQQQLQYLSETIELLEKRGYDWRLFSNGLNDDYAFGKQLLEYMNRSSESYRLLPQPKKTKELVQTISTFKGMISPRLHSGIVAYSLDIPLVGIVCNEKIKFFGDGIGYPKRFIHVSELTAQRVVDALEQAIKEGYDQERKEQYKMTVYRTLSTFPDYMK